MVVNTNNNKEVRQKYIQIGNFQSNSASVGRSAMFPKERDDVD